MAYRNVLSQMFDVRPLTGRGDLDVERIARIREVLDLVEDDKDLFKQAGPERVKTKAKKEKKGMAKDSVFKPPKILVEKTASCELTTKEKEMIMRSFLPQESLVVLQEAEAEIYSGNLPSRDDLLAQLDEIEKLNSVLKKDVEMSLKKREEFQQAAEILEEELLASLAISREDFVEIPQSFAVVSPSDQILATEELIENTEAVSIESSAPVIEQSIVQTPEIPVEALVASNKTPSPVFEWTPLKISRFLNERPQFSFRRSAAVFAGAGALIFLIIFGLSLAGRGLSARSSIMSSGLEAYRAMIAGKDSAARLDFSSAQVNFETAYENFLQADKELNKMGGVLISVLEALPGASSVSSGDALIEAGKNLAQAGQSFSKIGGLIVLEKIGDYFSDQSGLLAEKIAEVQRELNIARQALQSANQNLAMVKSADLPADLAPGVDDLKNKLPVVAGAVAQLNDWSGVFLNFAGHNKAKKYLLIFQNNAEARPTGGFIGTYGVLDLDRGAMRNLFIDGIFNLDGQLDKKVVPPQPIQKISTAWSAHDANWFADFPTSAKKIMGFYEAAAGGSTVDGVISLTPTVIERLLAVTGPVELPEYGVSLNQDNFAELIQYKVEADYDKELNQPKKILADFAPKFLAKLWEIWPQKYDDIIEISLGALAQKHILFYFSDPLLEKKFVNQGWGGEILATDRDYLSVVNTNINGFKTDKVIEQTIVHESQVFEDGSVVDSVTITRRHNGGREQYDWYNKVNADFLRVYVPAGSKLLSAQGYTRETVKAPADYAKLNFVVDPDVAAQEQSRQIDADSGTQIFSESGKTVFGNWTYVSPGETVKITYHYLLPFKIDLNVETFSWSLLAQKQAGSISSGFASTLKLPQEFKINWKYPENLEISGSQIKFSGDLKTDEFYGLVFTR